jgi:hypothetical protein
MTKRWIGSMAWASLVGVIVLKLLFLGVLYSWASFSPTNLIDQIDLQRARSQRIAKDALILSTNPTDDERAQAISEMQNMLPGWQATQAGLRQGDRSLGLPRSVPENIQLVAAGSQADYTAMLNATKIIVASPAKPPDPVQVDIILNHERGYFLALSQVEMLWQQQIDTWRWQFFTWACIFLVAVIVVIVLTHFFITTRVIRLAADAATALDAYKKEHPP